MAAEASGSNAVAGKKQESPIIFWLLGVFLLAAALRTIAVLTRQMVQFDEASYARMAENLLLGHAPWDITHTSAVHLSVLYPVVIASFAVVIRSYVAAGYVVSVLFGSLLVLPTFMFGKVMWNRRVGVAAAALVAVLPVMIDKSSTIDGQNLYAFWLMCAMFFGYRMQFTKRCMCGMLAGTCLGIAYLDDPTALYYLVVLFGLLVIIGFRQEVASYANRAASHFVLMFALFAIPNIIFMSVEVGGFTVQARPVDELYAAVHNLRPQSLEWDRQMMRLDSSGNLVLPRLQQGDGLAVTLIRNPTGVFTAILRQINFYYIRNVATLFPAWLLMLIGLGVFKTVWSRREALKYGYFALMLLPLATLPLKWPDVRFMMPYIPIFMLWAARGWLGLEAWGVGSVSQVLGWKHDNPRRKLAVQVAIAILVLAPVAALGLWSVAQTDYPVQYKQAGEWLKDHGGDGSRIMSRESSTAYYAGGTLVMLPYASMQQVLDYGHRQHADFLVISQQQVDQLRPQLKDLMNPALAGPRLKMVYRYGAGTGADIIVYRLLS